MSLLGTRLTLLIGQTVPVPAPVSFMEAFDRAEVTHSDEGRSGFQITFKVGRTSVDVLDYALLSSPLLHPMNRVVLMVTFNAIPQVLMDGIITHQAFSPGNQPGTSTLTVTGEDVSLMMDMEEKSEEHPAQAESVIALKIIGSYAQYGLVPKVIPPPSLDMPLPTERTPVQQVTDLQYLQEMASRFGYVFYITPGPFPLTNTAYWGPPVREGIPQKAISINMGPGSNAEIPNFSHDGLATTFVSGKVQDRTTNEPMTVENFGSLRIPLVSRPDWATQRQVRKRQFRNSGLSAIQALTRVQSEANSSTDRAVNVSGELDANRYETLLQPRGLVNVRGAGYNYDGLYYVKSVTHNIDIGQYKQRFTLTREGMGAISPMVMV